MCMGSPGQTRPLMEKIKALQEESESEKIGWDWWNRPGINKGNSGSYQLNRLAIGNPLETARGTSQLKNISSNSPRETTGIDRPKEWGLPTPGLIPNPEKPEPLPKPISPKPIPEKPEPPPKLPSPKPPGIPSRSPSGRVTGIRIRGER